MSEGTYSADNIDRQGKTPDKIKSISTIDNPSVFRDDNLVEQINVMVEFAAGNGYDVPPSLLKKRAMLAGKDQLGFDELELEELATIHQQLNRIVAPATPQALLLLANERERGAILSSIALIPIVRHIIMVSLFFLTMFIVIGQMEMVNQKNLTAGILGNQGLVAIVILFYLVSCAGLGACFTSLYRLKEFLTESNFDPRYNSTYWASILLGVIAGLFISELLYTTLVSATTPDGSPNTITNMGKPALALLGGFSANMVYKMLQRIVDSVESLFRGDRNAIGKAQHAKGLAELQNKQDEIQMDLANRLLVLNNLLDSDPEKAKSVMQATIKDLLKK
jgi:hypothetical protein